MSGTNSHPGDAPCSPVNMTELLAAARAAAAVSTPPTEPAEPVEEETPPQAALRPPAAA